MHIHKKGIPIIFITAVVLAVPAAITFFFNPVFAIALPIYIGLLAIFFWTISFFRVPHRQATLADNAVISSADGTVVVIEKVFEPEYFKDDRLQISVFMSPFNVHVNWFPMNGVVSYMKYHPGKFLIANHPKSSTENERNTMVVKDAAGREVLVRQVAGMMARRIVWFTKTGEKAALGSEFGLIRFGSRVDFYVPTDAQIQVKIGDKVKGQITVLAEI
ncbi:MAG TPA: phosphatidylserine decarboxylase family protein [Bacteroidales bacterium]|nr:phosphatidylserine decarboxylase family protein [Bacteroidales bacterium]